MKKILAFLTTIAAAISLTVSCTDISEIEERVDGLESRVEALETICAALNSNVAALQAFTTDNKSISKVVEKDGIYTLTLSDGTSITLNQGSEGAAVMPDITVKNGNWFVNGTDTGVKATGADGKTPVFGVDKDGYWTVRYSEDETSQQVTDEDGNPVKAIPDGSTPGESSDQFFEDVKVEDDKVTIVLKNGKDTYSLPIIADFICAIKNIGDDPVLFERDEKKEFIVELKNVTVVTIFKPSGWEATLEANKLTVIAPAAEPLTKISADTRQDVSILALSKTGFGAIAKIRVSLSDTPLAPEASITAGTATDRTLSFTVSVTNATEWYYMLKPASEAAPTAADLKAATKGTDTELTLNTDASGTALTTETQYTLYVLPISEEADGDIAKATLSTTEKVYASLLDKYNDGQDIVIGEKIYNKTTYGDAVHITKENPSITTAYNGTDILTKVYFIDADANATYDCSVAVKYMILIGNSPNSRSKLTVNQQIKLNQGQDKGEFVISGIVFDSSAMDNYPLVQNAKGAFEYVLLQNCRIKIHSGRPLTYISSPDRSYKVFSIMDSDIELQQKNFIISLGSSTATYGTVSYVNNIFYTSSNTAVEDFRLFDGKSATLEKIVLNNNTFVNLHTNAASSTSALGAIYTKALNSVECTDNLIFTNKAMGKHSMFIKSETYPKDGTGVNTNIVYKGGDLNSEFNWQIAYGGVKNIPNAEEITILTDNPFDGETFDITNCIFTPKAEYATYGAQR